MKALDRFLSGLGAVVALLCWLPLLLIAVLATVALCLGIRADEEVDE